MNNLNVLDILKLGAIGLGFLLAFLAFRLLQKEQSLKQPRESILKSVRTYMIFAVILVVIASISELLKPQLEKRSTVVNSFDFEDYLEKNRIKYQKGENPENFIKGDLNNLETKTLTLELPAGSCKSFLAVTPPNTEIEINWWTNGPGARDVKFISNGSDNIKFGSFCTSEDPKKPAQLGLQIKMLRGQGPFALEVYFASQRVYK